MSTPRPILKRCSRSADTTTVGPHPQPSSTPPRISNTVRFPPSPTLTRICVAHSASTYDRSPIVVGPNTCALPARGCPGRTYVPGDTSYSPDAQRHLKNKGKSLHPRATTAMGLSFAAPSPPHPALPPLIPDLSSESDESDGFTSPPHDVASVFSSGPLAIPISATLIPDDAACLLTPTPLSFLPHPPCAPYRQQGPEEEHMHHTYEEEKRRRREKETRRERNRWDTEQRARSRDAGVRDLAPSAAGGVLDEEDVDEEDDEDDDLAGRYKSFGSGALSGFALEADDGCLGGF